MSSINYTNEEEDFIQPKILNLKVNGAEKAKLLRKKSSFVAAGPPMQKNKPSTEEFYDWKFAIIQYLEFVPGCQAGILEIPLNLEGMSAEENLPIILGYLQVVRLIKQEFPEI